MKGNIRFALIVASTLVLTYVLGRAGGCRDSSMATNRVATESAPPSVRLVPEKLFAGDLERLRPHLRLTATGFFRAEITGPSVMLGSDLELWMDGVKSEELGFHIYRVSDPATLSFSLQEYVSHEGKKKYSLVSAVTGSTGGASSIDLDQPELRGRMRGSMRSFGTAEIRKPLILSEGESVLIWAYLVDNDAKRPVLDPIEEAVKNSQWAIVAKARWYRPEDLK